MQFIRKILSLIGSDTRRLIPGVLFLGLGASLLEMLGLGILPLFIEVLVSPNKVAEISTLDFLLKYIDTSSSSEIIYLSCGVLLVFFTIKTAYMIKVQHIQALFMRKVMVDVGKNMFKTYLYAPYTFHLHAESGDIIRNVTHSPQYFAASVVLSMLKVFFHGVISIGVVVTLLVFNPEVTLLALFVPTLVAFVFMSVIKKATNKHGEELQNSLGYLSSLTNHALGSIKETHVRGCHIFLYDSFMKKMNILGAAHQFQKFAPVIAKPVMELFGVIVLVVIIIYFVMTGQGLDDALPLIVLFVAAIARLIQNIFPLTQSMTSIRSYSPLVHNLYNDYMSIKQEQSCATAVHQEASGSNEKVHLKSSLSLDNVVYSYPDASVPALNDISLSISKNTAVAFVGSTGSGKSTLLDVILGLLKPQTGTVFVDGLNIYTNLRKWQNDIGYIPQTIYMLNDTIRQNVAFGVSSEDVDEGRLWKVLKIAQIDEFIKSLPDGLDTKIGERGVRISGGERQRIGIARALYHDPDVLIMDEATSALDPATESAVMSEISMLKKDLTVIIVAHRLSTVRECDNLFLLKNGKIVGQGTYDEMLANNDEFRLLSSEKF